MRSILLIFIWDEWDSIGFGDRNTLHTFDVAGQGHLFGQGLDAGFQFIQFDLFRDIDGQETC